MSTIDQNVVAVPGVEPRREGAGEYLRRRWSDFRSGELGSLPVILGLILIAVIFELKNENFISSVNFVNLMVQMAGVTVVAIGVVFVLLIGEIDLSVGYVSGVAAAIAAILMIDDGNGVPGLVAVSAALAVGASIGALQGFIITKFKVPSFVVTLAGLLAWNGVVLILMRSRGTVVVQDNLVVGLANDFLPGAWAYIVTLALVGGYATLQIARFMARRKAGVPTEPTLFLAGRIIVLAAVGLLVVYAANQSRGVPYVTLVLMMLIAFWSFIAVRTRFGRHVYAVGGNAEAARRAGINVNLIRIAVFTISGTMAALGGIILASRLRSVDIAAGGGDLLLNAIAAAVIGGTSLFGGRGNVTSALLGGLVIASVANGMALISLSAGLRFVVTGLILLAAVTVDSFSRRRLAQVGR